jgi:hypothetical protein
MPKLVVVDGSNIATEGRAMPSLQQLQEAVMAFREENPGDLITVVVDATFGHRIEPAEVPEFDAAVEHNELVTPPAGAIGRGDAFVLTIANKAGATVLSNDSFQEFHGHYPWLFDEGRLIGGKPVPHVGWVFVARTPVRGPASRKSVRVAREGVVATKKHGARKQPEAVASPDGAPAKRRKRADVAAAASRVEAGAPPAANDHAPHRAKGAEAPTPGRQQMVNELLPFLAFVEQHPVGTQVEGVADSYSSHGAYVAVGVTRCYVPLRYLGSPAPRSAREALKLGTNARFTVVSFNPARRSIDLALAGFEPSGLVPAAAPAPAKRARKKVVAEPVEAAPTPVKRSRKKSAVADAVEPAPVPAKRVRKKALVEPVEAVPTPAKRSRKKAVAAPVDATPVPVKRSRKKAALPAPSAEQPAVAAAPRRRRAKAAPA